MANEIADDPELLELELALLELEDDDGRSSFSQFAAGTSRGVAKTLGAPVDIVNSFLSIGGGGHEKPLGGSENIQSFFEKIGVGVSSKEDLGRPGRVGELVGTASTASAGLVSAGVKSLGSQVGQVIRQPSIVTGITQDVARNAIANPVTFAGYETASAVGAGLASFEATERFPDSPTAQFLAEMAGGFSPLVAMVGAKGVAKLTTLTAENLPLTGVMIRGIRNMVKSVLPKGAATRARTRVERSSPNIETSLAKIDRTDILPESGLTPVQKMGDPELLALERSIAEVDAQKLFAREQQLSVVNQRITESMTAQGKEAVPTHQVKSYLSGLLDERIRQAALLADDKLAALGTKATREDLNVLARQEMRIAQVAARNQEKELYLRIPAETKAPTTASQEVYQDLKLKTARAQRSDIPDDAKKFLEPTKPGKKGPEVNKDFFGDETEVLELRGLQSRLREHARIARSEKRFNSARIADDIADAITDDIANAVGDANVREAVEIATKFSVDLNDRFTRGPMARIMGTERAGGAKVPDSLTLEETVGRRGPRARSDTDALLETVRRHGDEAAMRDHIEGFLIDDFRRAAVVGGNIEQKAAAKWMNENQDVLNRFPELRRDMTAARQAGGEMIETQRLADPKVSRAAIFINAPPGQEIERVLNTAEPGKAMKELIKLARNDVTGNAERGLKASFFDMLLRKSHVPGSKGLDVHEDPFISGRLLTKQMNDEAVLQGMRELYNPQEIRRLNKIRETALLLDKARLTPPSAEGVIGDKPGKILDALVGVTGAQIGRVVARHTGGGTVQTPGIAAGHARKLLESGVRDPAKQLLIDSIEDESLFRALFIDPETVAEQAAIKARLNAWAIDVMIEQNQYEEDE